MFNAICGYINIKILLHNGLYVYILINKKKSVHLLMWLTVSQKHFCFMAYSALIDRFIVKTRHQIAVEREKRWRKWDCEMLHARIDPETSK